VTLVPELRETPRSKHGVALSEFGYEAQLRRSLTLGDLLVYGLVFISPIAPFAIFGIVFNASKGMTFPRCSFRVGPSSQATRRPTTPSTPCRCWLAERHSS
jgi:hypothetical protein